MQSQSNEQHPTCEICKMTFTVIYNLHRHIKTVHNKERLYSCTFCELSFSTNDNLKKHLKRDHIKGGETTLSCKVCDKTFARKSYLTKHVMIVHKKVQPIECTECNRSFLFSNHMKRHMVTYHPHSNIKPYACNLCDQRFADFKVLLHHKIQHSNHSEEKDLEPMDVVENYYCDLCHSTFILKINLDLHIRRCHNEDVKLHFCELCNFQCGNKDVFKKHANNHFKKDFLVKIVNIPMQENTSLLCCEICDKAFTDKGKLAKHKIHHIRKNAKVDLNTLSATALSIHQKYDFLCKLCGESFWNKNMLLSHKFNHLQQIKKEEETLAKNQNIESLVKKEISEENKEPFIEEKDNFNHNSLTNGIANYPGLDTSKKDLSYVPTFAHKDLPVFQSKESSADIKDEIQDTKDNDSTETVSSKDEGVFDLEDNIDDLYYDCLSDDEFPFPILELVEDRPESIGDRLEADNDRLESVGNKLESAPDRVVSVNYRQESVYDRHETKKSIKDTFKKADSKSDVTAESNTIMYGFPETYQPSTNLKEKYTCPMETCGTVMSLIDLKTGTAVNHMITEHRIRPYRMEKEGLKWLKIS